MRVLITGGAGFIGSNLVHFLERVDPTIEVVVLDDLSTGSVENLRGAAARVIVGSVLHPQPLSEAVKGVDSIVHLAALPSVPRSLADPIATHHANATGTLMVLEAARAQSVNHVIVASSSSVYGSNPSMPKREDAWTRPLSPYAVSKLATEAYALAYASSFGLDSLAFRFFNVYGPRQAADHAYAAVVPTFVDRVLAGRSVPREGDGEQSRDFTHVDTVCAAIHTAIRDRLSSSSPINLAFGTNTSINQLIAVIEEAVGERVAVEELPPRLGDVRASRADGAALARLMPDLAPVDLQHGIESVVQWFRGRRSTP